MENNLSEIIRKIAELERERFVLTGKYYPPIGNEYPEVFGIDCALRNLYHQEENYCQQ